MTDEATVTKPDGASEFDASQARADSPLTRTNQTQAPESPRGWLRGLLRRKDSQAGKQAEVAQDQQPKTETKSGGVMAELDAKNKELGGNLAHKFGKGEGQFMILNGPSKQSDNGVGVEKYLIATNEGYKVLAVKLGKLMPNPNAQGQFYTDRDNPGSLADSLVTRLVSRDNPKLDGNGPDATEGSGFKHEGRSYSLNFGKDHILQFKEPGFEGDDKIAYIQPANDTIQELAARSANSSTRTENRSKQILGDMETHSTISFEQNPTQDEVAEIMQGSYKAAEEEYKRQQQSGIA